MWIIMICEKYCEGLRNLSINSAIMFNVDIGHYNYCSQFFIYWWIQETGSNSSEVIGWLGRVKRGIEECIPKFQGVGCMYNY